MISLSKGKVFECTGTATLYSMVVKVGKVAAATTIRRAWMTMTVQVVTSVFTAIPVAIQIVGT
jgi:hypothetical protein